MTDYSSPIRRKSIYSSPSSRSFINHPPPEGSLRDTTINVATAFSNADQYRTRSPQFHSSLSNHTSHLGNNYILSPSQRLSSLKRNSDNYATLVDPDNEFFDNGQIKMDLYGQQSSLSQSSSSDDEMDDNPFEEEELLALNPSEEEHRRGLIQQRSNTSDRGFSNYASSFADSSFHSLGDNKNGTNTVDNQDDKASYETHPATPSTRPRIQLALERTFEIVMFWVFMVFWVIKEIAVAVFTFIFILVSTLVVNPIVFVLQLIGFHSLEPLELPQLKSSLARGGSSSGHSSRLLRTYSITRKLTILAVVAFGCYYWVVTGSSSETPHFLQQQTLWDRFHNTITPLSTAQPSATGMNPPPAYFDSAMKNRFATLEKSLQGLIHHVEMQDQNSQQQIKSINYHLDQLQQQLSKLPTSQSTQMESTMLEQMDKMEEILATTTTEWTDRLQQWESQMEEKYGQPHDDLSPKLVDALHQIFVSKSDASEPWETFLQRNKGELDQYIQGLLGDWIEEQRRQGAWVDMDKLNETLMAQLVHAYNNDDGGNWMITPETSMMIRGLIDTAIQKYHQDVLDTPDYALATRGAMVLMPYTSATFTHDSTHQSWWWAQWYSGWSQAYVSPMVALTPGTHAGQCWPMKGDHGSLGIRLSEPISVQAVTMEYPSRAMVANHLSSAPKEFEVWGIKSIDDAMMSGNNHNDPNMIFLGSFTYDIKPSAASLQTFSLDTNRYIVLQGVVLRIHSNWGHPDYTCLYRVRVHGIPAV